MWRSELLALMPQIANCDTGPMNKESRAERAKRAESEWNFESARGNGMK